MTVTWLAVRWIQSKTIKICWNTDYYFWLKKIRVKLRNFCKFCIKIDFLGPKIKDFQGLDNLWLSHSWILSKLLIIFLTENKRISKVKHRWKDKKQKTYGSPSCIPPIAKTFQRGSPWDRLHIKIFDKTNKYRKI